MPGHFWFRIDRMTPSDEFHQRSVHGRWRPPRPRLSNIIEAGHATTRLWFEHRNNSTSHINQPNLNALERYSTFSFYMNGGNIYVYPQDATLHTVGDGSGNQHRTHNNNASRSSTDSEGEGPQVEDWRSLSFNWHHGPTHRSSYATHRGEQTTLQCHRANQMWARQLIPNVYLAPPNRQPPAEMPLNCPLLGDLPIIIALIAFSVPPNQVHLYLANCFREQYHGHNVARGTGWTDRRGMVVSVFCQPGTRGALRQVECGQLGVFFP
ncbi:Hypothetical protein R9X50_00680500 [Acrodontium crateriforme]|uniref:Uncharacterized protein n=1 Tax=Acrodontium crateriforme TaxID=150365 RepID=A0AAQ3MAG7_9PEZI|nr:Hypothetical protein R9X50_00680500 [Acrodontium crateriforme]